MCSDVAAAFRGSTCILQNGIGLHVCSPLLGWFQANPFSAFNLSEMNAPNEPSQPPIDLSNLPSSNDIPDPAVSLPPEILNMLRDPKRHR